MRVLVAEDDFASRKSIMKYLSQFGECDVTVDGMEATFAYTMALDEENYYDLVCLDVMMPVLDGYQALKAIRNMEDERKIPEDKRTKIIMMTALNEEKNVTMAFELGCSAYCAKPIDFKKFEELLRKLDLIS